MKIGIIIEARTGSSRLPGKVLKKIGRQSILEFMISRINNIKKVNNIIIATTTKPNDKKIIELAKKNKVNYYCGSENNLTERVLKASTKFKLDIIISLTGDCPLIDRGIIEQCLEIFLNNNVNFLSNCHLRSYPDGMDVQIFYKKLLKQSLKFKYEKKDLEHTTLPIRKNLKKLNYINIIAPKELRFPKLGLTLDEKKDFELIKKIIKHFKNNNFSCVEIIKYLNKNKNLLKINNKVKRKNIIFNN